MQLKVIFQVCFMETYSLKIWLISSEGILHEIFRGIEKS